MVQGDKGFDLLWNEQFTLDTQGGSQEGTLVGFWTRSRNLNSHSNTVMPLFHFSCLYVVFLPITYTGIVSPQIVDEGRL